jgi:hypothetical protein
MFICILAFYYVGKGNEIDFKIRSTIDGYHHFDSISISKAERKILYNTYQEMAIWKSIVSLIYKEFYLPLAGK